MKEISIKLNVMLSDEDYGLIEEEVRSKNLKGRTVGDELKTLARKGITKFINERKERK